MPSTKTEQESIKWWVDQQRPGHEGRKNATPAPAAARFYISAKGFEQERARSGLVDLNVKLLEAANPPDDGFGYLSLIDERVSAKGTAYLTDVGMSGPHDGVRPC